MSVSKRVLDIRNCQDTKAKIVSMLSKDTKMQVRKLLPSIAELLSVVSELKKGNELWEDMPYPNADVDDEWDFDIQRITDKKAQDSVYCVLLPKNVAITEDACIVIIDSKDGDAISEVDINVFSDYSEEDLYTLRKSLSSLNRYIHVLYRYIDGVIKSVNLAAVKASKGSFDYALGVEPVEESIDVSNVLDNADEIDEDTDEIDILSEETIEEQDAEIDETIDNDILESDNSDNEDEDGVYDNENDAKDGDIGENEDETLEEESDSIDLNDFDAEMDNDEKSSEDDDSNDELVNLMKPRNDVENSIDDLFNNEDEDFVPTVYESESKEDDSIFDDHVEISFIQDGGRRAVKFPLKYMPEAKTAPFKQYLEASFPLKDKSGKVNVQVLGKYCRMVDAETVRMILDDKSHYMVFLPSGKKSMVADELEQFFKTELV